MTQIDIQDQIAELKRQQKNEISGSPEDDELQQQIRELEERLEEAADDPLSAEPPQLPEDEPAASLHQIYLLHLLETSSRLELSGIDRKAAGQNPDTCLNLATIYTALLTRSTDMAFGKEQGAERRLSALELVNRHKYLILLGEPGSGKSTFVKFLAMCLAGELLEHSCANLECLTAPLPDDEGNEREENQQWDFGGLLPVCITLRDFAAEGLPPVGQAATVTHFWDFLCAWLEERRLHEYAKPLEEMLRRYGGLLLFDGLDEVPDATQRRPQIRELIDDVVRSFPRCRILVTSRTYAYQEQDWRLPDFQDTVLASFTQGQIRRFIDRWYQNVSELRGQSHSHAQGQAERLKGAVFQNQRLFNFAQRPLLLTLMASLHAWRGGSLPEQRAELYAEATDLLLDWWESSKVVRDEQGQIVNSQPSLTELLRVGKTPVERVLQQLAFQAHQSQKQLVGTADIPEAELVAALLGISDEDLKPKRLIEYLSDRAGLLVPHGVGVYSFPHRSFQEYLTACYLSNQDDYPDNLTKLACSEPNRWREVLLLAAARFSEVAMMFWGLVDALCYQDVTDDESNPQHAWGALLAGQVLVESVDFNTISLRHQLKVDRIREWLAAILTEQQPFDSAQGKPSPFPVVERALAGNVLAALGDSRPGVGVISPPGRGEGWVAELLDIEWCEIPKGIFLMGSDPAREDPEKLLEDIQIQYDRAQATLDDDLKAIFKRLLLSEQPQHQIMLSDYSVSRYPVTNAHYQTFINDDGYTERWKACWGNEGWDWKEEEHISLPESFDKQAFHLPNHPVVGLSWYESSAFCAWLTLRLREAGELSDEQEIRLPTEAEWEKAARGIDSWIYPWGNEEISPQRANYYDTGLGVTSPVGCFSQGKSPYGCEEMAGNVFEWCWDWYGEQYYAESPGENPTGPAAGSRRVVRGGHWGFFAGVCRAAFRDWYGPGLRFVFVGFRLLRT